MEPKGPRKEIVNDQGIVAILYFFIISIIIGNFVCYRQQLLISLSKSSKTFVGLKFKEEDDEETGQEEQTFGYQATIKWP